MGKLYGSFKATNVTLVTGRGSLGDVIPWGKVLMVIGHNNDQVMIYSYWSLYHKNKGISISWERMFPACFEILKSLWNRMKNYEFKVVKDFMKKRDKAKGCWNKGAPNFKLDDPAPKLVIKVPKTVPGLIQTPLTVDNWLSAHYSFQRGQWDIAKISDLNSTPVHKIYKTLKTIYCDFSSSAEICHDFFAAGADWSGYGLTATICGLQFKVISTNSLRKTVSCRNRYPPPASLKKVEEVLHMKNELQAMVGEFYSTHCSQGFAYLAVFYLLHNRHIIIPAHIVPRLFFNAALDNLNFHSETEDGGNVDATTNIIYHYSRGEETADCVVRVPYDPKVRRKTIQMPEKFQLVSNHRTLKERKEARSLRSVDLSDADIGDRP
ncbi:hypothetical protein GQR58_008956 [Nymphon striatum]|nr:hypothetical protein GQR58_008956 [Nymphon striatum]